MLTPARSESRSHGGGAHAEGIGSPAARQTHGATHFGGARGQAHRIGPTGARRRASTPRHTVGVGGTGRPVHPVADLRTGAELGLAERVLAGERHRARRCPQIADREADPFPRAIGAASAGPAVEVVVACRAEAVDERDATTRRVVADGARSAAARPIDAANALAHRGVADHRRLALELCAGARVRAAIRSGIRARPRAWHADPLLAALLAAALGRAAAGHEATSPQADRVSRAGDRLEVFARRAALRARVGPREDGDVVTTSGRDQKSDDRREADEHALQSSREHRPQPTPTRSLGRVRRDAEVRSV